MTQNESQSGYSQYASAWTINQDRIFLNHGSFGACPRQVLQRQSEYREQLEREPVQFFTRRMQPVIDESRKSLANLIGADPIDVAFVPNATSGVNAVLRSIEFEPGDELLITDHAYNACHNALVYVADRCGAEVTVARVSFPIESPSQVVDTVIERVTDRTRIAVIDHITSPTALIFPVKQIVDELAHRGVDTLVDGAHAPGMVPLNLHDIGAAYYTGNCHKWLCAPKSAGFLHVRADKQDALQPSVISHGYNVERRGYSRFQDYFDWIGTIDPTPWMCVRDSIEFVQSLMPGGMKQLMRHNNELAIAAQKHLCGAMEIVAPCPPDMIGSMVTIPISCEESDENDLLDFTTVPTPTHRVKAQLYSEHHIEVPIFFWPAFPQCVLRVSAQAYNTIGHFERLAKVLTRTR